MSNKYDEIYKLLFAGFIMIFIGFFILLISSIFQVSTSLTNSTISVGVLFIFGFIPIGIAFGPQSGLIMIILMILAIALIIFMFLLTKFVR